MICFSRCGSQRQVVNYCSLCDSLLVSACSCTILLVSMEVNAACLCVVCVDFSGQPRPGFQERDCNFSLILAADPVCRPWSFQVNFIPCEDMRPKKKGGLHGGAVKPVGLCWMYWTGSNSQGVNALSPIVGWRTGCVFCSAMEAWCCTTA